MSCAQTEHAERYSQVVLTLTAGGNARFVGAGDGPCVIFMAGRRTSEKEIVYPRSELARRHSAGVETETRSVPRPTRHSRTGSPTVRKAGTTLPWAE